MTKVLSVLLVIFLAVGGGILYFQWNDYKEAVENAPAPLNAVDETIAYTFSSKAMIVEHTMLNVVKNTKYAVTVPKNVQSLQCRTNEKACQIRGGVLQLSETGDVVLTYKIPLRFNARAFLWTATAVQLEKKWQRHQTIKLYDYNNRRGTWLANGKFVGKAKKKLFDYYEWTKIKSLPLTFYYELAPHNLKRAGATEWFATGDTKSLKVTEWQKKYPFIEHVTIVYSVLSRAIVHPGLLVIPVGQTAERYDSLLVDSTLRQRFMIAPSDSYTVHTLAMLLTKVERGNKAAVLSYRALVKQFGHDKAAKVGQQLLTKERITTAQLDEALATVTGEPTAFFTLNRASGTVPYYVFVPKTLVVAKKKQSFRAIVYKGETYYPFEAILKADGYKLSYSRDIGVIEVEKGLNFWRFYSNNAQMTVNSQSYGVLENALTRVGTQYFMKRQWWEDMFFMKVEEGDKEIVFSPQQNAETTE